LGAAFVFAAGMFFLTLGRQVKASVVSTMEDGGRFRVPLSMIPFSIDHNRVGHIQEVDVQKGSQGLERINLTVRLKHRYDAESYSSCLFVLDSPHTEGLFSCLPEDAAEAAEYVKVGELRIEPGDVVRPLVVTRHNAEEWFDRSDLEAVKITASDGGAIIQVTDAEGTRVVDLTANAGGASLKVRDADGKEVVKMQAGARGVNIDVKKQ
jgi:hypothetical protein